jgi:hypothetical protein
VGVRTLEYSVRSKDPDQGFENLGFSYLDAEAEELGRQPGARRCSRILTGGSLGSSNEAIDDETGNGISFPKDHPEALAAYIEKPRAMGEGGSEGFLEEGNISLRVNSRKYPHPDLGGWIEEAISQELAPGIHNPDLAARQGLARHGGDFIVIDPGMALTDADFFSWL